MGRNSPRLDHNTDVSQSELGPFCVVDTAAFCGPAAAGSPAVAQPPDAFLASLPSSFGILQTHSSIAQALGSPAVRGLGLEHAAHGGGHGYGIEPPLDASAEHHDAPGALEDMQAGFVCVSCLDDDCDSALDDESPAGGLTAPSAGPFAAINTRARAGGAGASGAATSLLSCGGIDALDVLDLCLAAEEEAACVHRPFSSHSCPSVTWCRPGFEPDLSSAMLGAAGGAASSLAPLPVAVPPLSDSGADLSSQRTRTATTREKLRFYPMALSEAAELFPLGRGTSRTTASASASARSRAFLGEGFPPAETAGAVQAGSGGGGSSRLLAVLCLPARAAAAQGLLARGVDSAPAFGEAATGLLSGAGGGLTVEDGTVGLEAAVLPAGPRGVGLRSISMRRRAVSRLLLQP
ncbi:hypothetical protein HYH03_007130 [Edaphochlamys debaryana]|uniref:Uncharacterized protein n=1 Tax=Edaphochlamys debaryana TaxID=47281 RepID=A0A836C0G5_9CHLO|nr:hypothetical protein HYH03_007130 [Edaphochlamys debaryana]|eukprot:KAG2494892.1 hypothetical protein HYH03_007130 [Edaphochlamys debaryana]